ncbi:MAG: hypothetical protein KF803_01430 [Cyclobacteriaceae bacterium]|nr:hypothetical protein [Cyclobacteriaceae bacterium]
MRGETLFNDGSSSFDDFLINAYEFLKADYPKFYKMDNLSKLGFLAAEALVHDRNLKQYSPETVAVVLSNSAASLDTDLRFLQSTKNVASPALFVYTLPNIVVGEICIRHKITGENTFFVTPSFDPEFLCFYAKSLFERNHVQACIAGWVDVLDEHHDVFLYLIEKESGSEGMEHNSDALKKLYAR